MIATHGDPARRLPTPPVTPTERLDEIHARLEALLKRLPPREPERQES